MEVDFQKSPSSCLFSTCWKKDFSYLIDPNFSDPKMGRCTPTNQSCHEYSLLGVRTAKEMCLRLTSIWAGVGWESGKAMEFSILCQHKTVEEYLSRRDLCISAQLELGKVWLTSDLGTLLMERIPTIATWTSRSLHRVPLISLMKDQISQPNFLWHFSVLRRKLFRPTVLDIFVKKRYRYICSPIQQIKDLLR